MIWRCSSCCGDTHRGGKQDYTVDQQLIDRGIVDWWDNSKLSMSHYIINVCNTRDLHYLFLIFDISSSHLEQEALYDYVSY